MSPPYRSSSKLHSPLSQTTESTVIPDDTLSMLTVKELNKRVQGSSSIDIVKFWQCFWAFLWSRQYTVDSQAVHTYRYVLFKNAFWALFGRFWGDFYSLLNRHPAEPDAGRGRGAEAAAEDAEKQRVSEGRKEGR